MSFRAITRSPAANILTNALAGAALMAAPVLMAGAASLFATPAYAFTSTSLGTLSCPISDEPGKAAIACWTNLLASNAKLQTCLASGANLAVGKGGAAICWIPDGKSIPKSARFAAPIPTDQVRALIAFLAEGESIFLKDGKFDCFMTPADVAKIIPGAK